MEDIITNSLDNVNNAVDTPSARWQADRPESEQDYQPAVFKFTYIVDKLTDESSNDELSERYI